MKGVQVYLSQHHYEKLKKESERLSRPMGRIIAYYVDDELEREGNLSRYYDEYTLADETTQENKGKLFDFIDELEKDTGKDQLILMRYDIGIPDKKVLIKTLNDLIDEGKVKAYRKKEGKNRVVKERIGYLCYETVKNKKNDEDKRRRQYEKLKKEFEGK
jgi:hypothetical protein